MSTQATEPPSTAAADRGTAEPDVRLVAIRKTFGDVVAVDSIDLDVEHGEFFTMLGPSGSGKTTTLRLIAGFDQPDSGQIFLGGEDVARKPPYDRDVNTVFQDYALFPHMTVAVNVEYGLKVKRVAKAERQARVQETLEIVRMPEYGGRKPAELSGGQRQRVALARALAKQPKVFLLDEPLAALDRKLREETQFELIDLQRRLGTTFVIVTHDQEEAMTVADRIAVMDRGRIVQVATPAEIYEQPNSRYVAEFVGDVNLIEAKVAARSAGSIELASDLLDRPLRVASPVEASIGSVVWLALRPEKIAIALERPAEEGANAVEGVVEDIGYLGDLSIYHVRLKNGALIKAARPNLTRLLQRPIGWDDRVWLSWAPDAGVVLTR